MRIGSIVRNAKRLHPLLLYGGIFSLNKKFIDHDQGLSRLLKTYRPTSVPVLGKHNAAFAAALAASNTSVKAKEPVAAALPTLEELRSSVAAALKDKSLPYPKDLTAESYSEEVIGGMKSYVVRAENAHSVPTLIMFYGGGFCLNTLDAHKAFMANVAAIKSCNIIIPDYPLAPESKAPEIVARTGMFLNAFLKNPLSYGVSENIVLLGWSSGSNQALTLSLNLQKESETLSHKISQLVLLSPWIDLSMRVNREGPYQAQQNADTIAAGADLLEMMSKWYLPAGFKGNEPEFCPASRSADEIRKLPPVTVIVGGAEVLLGDGVLIADRLRRDGVPTQLIVLKNQTHNFPVIHQLSLDGVYVPELVADVVAGKSVDNKVGNDGLGLTVRKFNMGTTHIQSCKVVATPK